MSERLYPLQRSEEESNRYQCFSSSNIDCYSCDTTRHYVQSGMCTFVDIDYGLQEIAIYTK